MALTVQASVTTLVTQSAYSVGGKPESGLKNVLTIVGTNGENIDLIFDTINDVEVFISLLQSELIPALKV